MKKILVIMAVLLLAIPAISYAGSATSRWDMTIGGDVKFDVGYSDQSGVFGNDLWTPGVPMRNPSSGNTQAYDKYGTQLWGAGETGLNFFIKGPDAWGAKTSAFILGDFTGVWGSGGDSPGTGGSINYNTFDLLIAQINFDWADTSLQMGVGGSFFGMLPTFANQLAWGTINWGNKGAAPVAPAVTITQRFDKNWSAGFGMMSPYNQISAINTPGNMLGGSETSNMFRGTLPMFEGMIKYTSDSCGKVGPWQLLAEADGFWGQVREIYGPNSSHSDNNQWLGDFKVLVPIIPEKNGNKAGAFFMDGEVFMTQGAGQGGSWLGFGGGAPWLTDDYADRADPGDYNASVMWGAIGHADYYLTDAISFNAFYLYASTNPSQVQRDLNESNNLGVVAGSQWIAALLYDVNPAVRLAVQWDYTDVRYGAQLVNYKNNGSANDYRVSMYYFF